MTPLLGFTPDAPRTTPGVITDCVNFIPYEAGMEASPSAASTGIAALAAPCLQAATLVKLDDSARTFAASATRIYELSGTSWTDRSVGGGPYTTVTGWAFAQFGDASLAASLTNVLQVSTSGAFAAVSGGPQAKVLFSVVTSGGGFVIAANTSVNVDQWRCSGKDDHTTWTTSIATQANAGRLLGNDTGAITAGIEFGDRVLLFKRRTFFVGNYVGGDTTFSFGEVIGGAGCVGKDAVVIVDAGVMFLGPDQFWLFDGARPMPLADSQLRQWFFNDVSTSHIGATRMVYDRSRNRVFVFYPDTSSTGIPNAGLCYHLVKRQWGRLSPSGLVQAVLTFIQPAITIDGLTGTIDALPYTFDSPELVPSQRTIAIFNGSNVMQTLTGTPGASSFTTDDFGLEDIETRLVELRLRYDNVRPTTAQVTTYTLDEAGDSADLVGSISASDTPNNSRNKFDVRQCAKFHRAKFDFTGSVRVIGKEESLLPAGRR